jgi:colanic acid/amylovoran biosynthesis protein
MRIAVDAYFNNNLGDDLFLDILVDRYGEAEFHFLLNDQSSAKAFKANSRVNYKSRKEVLLNISKYDAYIMIGGSMFQEPENWKKQWRIFDITVKSFKFFGKSTFVLGSNFGPIKTNEYKQKYVSTFKKLTNMTVRDKYSYNQLENQGISLTLHPDIVLSRKSKKNFTKDDNLIGISVIDWPKNNTKEEYLSFNVELIKRLQIKNKSIRLFAFQDTNEISDLKLIEEILKELDSHTGIEVISYDGEIDAFLEKYSECNSMVTSRFHSLILSLLFTQKICPIIYSEKTLNTLEFLGLDFDYINLDKISKEVDVKKAEEILLNKDDQYDGKFIVELSKKADQHFSILDSLYKKQSGK